MCRRRRSQALPGPLLSRSGPGWWLQAGKRSNDGGTGERGRVGWLEGDMRRPTAMQPGRGGAATAAAALTAAAARGVGAGAGRLLALHFAGARVHDAASCHTLDGHIGVLHSKTNLAAPLLAGLQQGASAGTHAILCSRCRRGGRWCSSAPANGTNDLLDGSRYCDLRRRWW